MINVKRISNSKNVIYVNRFNGLPYLEKQKIETFFIEFNPQFIDKKYLYYVCLYLHDFKKVDEVKKGSVIEFIDRLKYRDLIIKQLIRKPG
jgi:hypothetical protein